MLITFIREGLKIFSNLLSDVLSDRERLQEYALPYFPDNEWLKKQWWHRLAVILSVLFLTVFLIFAFLSLLGFLLSFFGTIQSSIFQPAEVRKVFQHYGLVPQGIDWISFVWTLVFVLIGFTVPNLAYRAFLYVKTNDTWKFNRIEEISVENTDEAVKSANG